MTLSSSPRTHGHGAAAQRPSLVLIVDDNEKNLRLARDVLRAAGFETLEAARGSAAVELASEHLPDVILMDLRLPDMGGVAVVQELQVEERTAGIPVVALSALPLEEEPAWLLGAGFAGWLEKPIDVGAFPEQVRGYCSGAE